VLASREVLRPLIEAVLEHPAPAPEVIAGKGRLRAYERVPLGLADVGRNDDRRRPARGTALGSPWPRFTNSHVDHGKMACGRSAPSPSKQLAERWKHGRGRRRGRLEGRGRERSRDRPEPEVLQQTSEPRFGPIEVAVVADAAQARGAETRLPGIELPRVEIE